MGNIWYLSPSNQGANVGVDDYGTEQEQMYLLVGEITPHLDRAGVSFCVPEKTATLAQRVAESNAMGAKFHLALHSNAGGNGNAWGPVGLYYSDTEKAFCEKLVGALLALGQKNNRGSNYARRTDLDELRGTAATAAMLEVNFHDSGVEVEFITTHRQQIGEAIAKVIIAADGKEFVPVTSGEYLEMAVKLGLFPTDTDWDSPMTKEEAAELAVKLKTMIERG